MRCSSFLLVALSACDPEPIDLGNDSNTMANGGSDGGAELPAPAEPGVVADIDIVEGVTGFSLSIADDGSIYVAGIAQESATDSDPMTWFARFDAEGTLQWSDATTPNGQATVDATADGFYGYTWFESAEPRLERRTADGDVVWAREVDDVTSMAATADGGLVMGIHPGEGAWVRKQDADGVEEWGIFFEGAPDPDMFYVRSLDVASDGTIWGLFSAHQLPPHAIPRLTAFTLTPTGELAWEVPLDAEYEQWARVDVASSGAVVMRDFRGAWSLGSDGALEWMMSGDYRSTASPHCRTEASSR